MAPQRVALRSIPATAQPPPEFPLLAFVPLAWGARLLPPAPPAGFTVVPPTTPVPPVAVEPADVEAMLVAESLVPPAAPRLMSRHRCPSHHPRRSHCSLPPTRLSRRRLPLRSRCFRQLLRLCRPERRHRRCLRRPTRCFPRRALLWSRRRPRRPTRWSQRCACPQTRWHRRCRWRLPSLQPRPRLRRRQHCRQSAAPKPKPGPWWRNRTSSGTSRWWHQHGSTLGPLRGLS